MESCGRSSGARTSDRERRSRRLRTRPGIRVRIRMPARPMLDVHYSTGRGRYEPVRSGRPTRQSRRTPRSRPPGPRGQGWCLRSGPDARPSAAAAWSDREGRRRPSPGRPLAGPRSAPDQRARPASASLRRPAAAAPANSLWGPFRARPPARDDGTRRSARPVGPRARRAASRVPPPRSGRASSPGPALSR